MISIDKALFEFNADNQEFAQNINRRWESYYQDIFEQVAAEVMSVYNSADETFIIDKLSLDLGIIKEDVFDKKFPERLREELLSWFMKIDRQPDAILQERGVVRMTVNQSKLEILCYFLLHGYFPSMAQYPNISLLLKEVLDSLPDRFREFLEAYAHYDFLYRRLVFQFTDDELAGIVDKSHPDESKFINLYVRIQLNAYKQNPAQTVTNADYRNAVWILVLAYLFTETGSRFNRKQLVLYTLRGLAARFNVNHIELTNMLTTSIDKLEQRVAQIPDLWDILKEIRTELHHEIMRTDFHTLVYSIKEIVFSLRFGRENEISYLLSAVNLGIILSEPESSRKLLADLSEKEIHKIVTIVIPAESKFIISYSQLLNQHRQRGVFEGKAGNEFRLLKWEFIFQIIYNAPLSAFNRENFILSLIHRLGAHYNLSVAEVLFFLIQDKRMHAVYSSVDFLPILTKIGNRILKSPLEIDTKNRERAFSYQELMLIIGNPLTSARFVSMQKETQMHAVVRTIIPEEGDFVIAYSSVLDKLAGKGKLEGKSGSDFRILKWEFIFQYMLGMKQGLVRHKYFVYAVLQRLAAHYNQHVIDLLEYFSIQADTLGNSSEYIELNNILTELYRENVSSVIRRTQNYQMSNDSARHWILYFLGENAGKNTGEDVQKWFLFFLHHHAGQVRTLWKEGKLNAVIVFKLVDSTPSLQQMWINKIGDNRLSVVWARWETIYAQLQKEFSDSYLLQSITKYLRSWIIRLTQRNYLGLSGKEIDEFLLSRIKETFPVGVRTIINDICNHDQPNFKQIMKLMENNNPEREKFVRNEPIEVNNAGIVLFGPFFRQLFKMLEYLKSDMTFVDEEKKLRAIFLLQFFLYGREDSYDESKLTFNKLLVGLDKETPVPSELILTEKEKNTVSDMLFQLKNSWIKMRNTTPETFRIAFLQRSGTLFMDTNEKRLHVTVEDKAYDMLLDTLPWNFSMIKYPWLDFYIQVIWRKK